MGVVRNGKVCMFSHTMYMTMTSISKDWGLGMKVNMLVAMMNTDLANTTCRGGQHSTQQQQQ